MGNSLKLHEPLSFFFSFFIMEAREKCLLIIWLVVESIMFHGSSWVEKWQTLQCASWSVLMISFFLSFFLTILSKNLACLIMCYMWNKFTSGLWTSLDDLDGKPGPSIKLTSPVSFRYQTFLLEQVIPTCNFYFFF